MTLQACGWSKPVLRDFKDDSTVMFLEHQLYPADPNLKIVLEVWFDATDLCLLADAMLVGLPDGRDDMPLPIDTLLKPEERHLITDAYKQRFGMEDMFLPLVQAMTSMVL